ncbi:MAG: TonB-dependent receptor plug domain-containing protein [Spirochaetaceae bacterium]|jgi:iron complex outermembrane receptor protein|nr:TonB-dependent receptor plug domain-containing protein [Spirochaetaceae bacterium]
MLRKKFLVLFFLFVVSALSIFAEEAAGEDPEEDWAFAMEGPGITLEADRLDSTPVTPATDVYGARHNLVTEEQIREQGSLDILDTLRDVPGVMFSKRNAIGTNTGNSLYVRGRGYNHPSLDTTVSFDGVPRYGLIYGQSMADSVPVFAVNAVEVFKSPQPSSFGAGYAALNIIPKYQDEQGWSVETGFSGGSFLTFGENVSVGLRRGPFDVYAAQSWVSTDGHMVHSGAWQQSYYLNAGLWINAYWNLRLLGNYVDAETMQAPKSGQKKSEVLSTYTTNTIFTTATVNNEYDNARGFAKLYYNFTDFRILDEGATGSWSRQALNGWGLRAKEVFSFWKGSDLAGGIDLDMSDTVNENHKTSSPILAEFPSSTLFSPYAALSQYFSLGGQFYLIPSAGLRGYIHSVWKNSLSPQAGLVSGWKNLELSFSYARGVVYPAPALLQGMVESETGGGLYLEDVRPETVHHFEGGLSFKMPALFSLSASWYYDDGQDRIVAVGVSAPGNASLASYFRIQGLEGGGSFSFTRDWLMLKSFEFFAGYNWIISLRARGEDGNEVDRMPYTPIFTASAGFKWTFLENFRLSGDYQFLHGLYSGGLSPGSSSFFELSESQRLEDIDLLNLRLAYSFAYKPWRLENGEIFIAAANLLNRSYEYYQGYAMPGFSLTMGAGLKFK